MQKTITTMLLAAMLTTGIASATSTSTATTTATSTPNTKGICVAAAVNKRDSAMIVAHDAFSASIRAALTSRKDSLVTAWTSGTKETRKSAWTKFKTDMKSAHEKMRTDRKNSWNTFNTEAKACGANDKNNGWFNRNKHNKKDDGMEMEHEYKVENATYSY